MLRRLAVHWRCVAICCHFQGTASAEADRGKPLQAARRPTEQYLPDRFSTLLGAHSVSPLLREHPEVWQRQSGLAPERRAEGYVEGLLFSELSITDRGIRCRQRYGQTQREGPHCWRQSRLCACQQGEEGKKLALLSEPLSQPPLPCMHGKHQRLVTKSVQHFTLQAGRGPSNVESALHRHTTHIAAQPGMQSVLGGSDLSELMTLVRVHSRVHQYTCWHPGRCVGRMLLITCTAKPAYCTPVVLIPKPLQPRLLSRRTSPDATSQPSAARRSSSAPAPSCLTWTENAAPANAPRHRSVFKTD